MPDNPKTFTVERQEIGCDCDTEMCEVNGCRVRPVPYTHHPDISLTTEGAVNVILWDTGPHGGAMLRLCDKHAQELSRELAELRGEA